MGGLANDHSYQIYVTPDVLDLKGFNHIAFNLVSPPGEVMRITSHANGAIGSVGIGTTAPAGLLDISEALSATPSLTGQYLSLSASTLTDNNTAASGTLTNAVFNSIAAPTLAATNTGVTTTNAYTFYIAGAPTAGTNETITNPYALGVNGKTAINGNLTLGPATSHVISSQTTADTATVTGAGYAVTSPVVSSTDTRGQMSATVAATTAGTVVLAFNAAYASAPICTVTPANAAAAAELGAAGSMWVTSSTSAMTLNFPATSVGGAPEIWNYSCIQ